MHEASMYATLYQAPQNYRLRPAPDYSTCLSERIPDGTSEDDYHITDVAQSEIIIMLSQVDQALCDEAEAGRIHGQGLFVGSCWENGCVRINLHAQWYSCATNRLIPLGNWEPSTGMPCIERISPYSLPVYLNNDYEWNTLFPYLRMSTESQLYDAPTIWGGATQLEIDNATVLCKNFKLSGRWGGKNRVAENANWYEDKTVAKSVLACGWMRIFLDHVDCVPTHCVIYNIYGDYAIILPEMILHRPNFEARRVFMSPEDIHYPICRGYVFSGKVNVTLSFPKPYWNSNDLFLCYPGGAKAVDICDLTRLYHAKEINLLILNKQGLEGWKFAMKFAARLRKNYMSFNIKLLTGCEYRTLTLQQFRKYLRDQSLIVPEELSDDFGGSLNAFMKRNRNDLIPGILGQGEAMLVSGTFCPEVALYLANSIRQGCWSRRWRAVKRNCKELLFADKYGLAKIEKTEKTTGVDIRSGNIPLEDAKQLIKDRDLVIFASQDMQRDKSRYHELLKFCLEHDISVIVFAENTDVFVSQVAGRFYKLNCQLNAGARQYTLGSAETRFGVNFTLTPQVKLASCRDLSETELNELCNRQNSLQVHNGTDCIVNLSEKQIHDTLFGDKIFQSLTK